MKTPLFDVLNFGDIRFGENAKIIKKEMPTLQITPNKTILTDYKRYWALLEIDNGTAIFDHVIKDRTCCNPEFISHILDYVFQRASICNTFIEINNKASIKFTGGLGFLFTGILRQNPIYLAIYSMTSDEFYTSKWAEYL